MRHALAILSLGVPHPVTLGLARDEVGLEGFWNLLFENAFLGERPT